MFQCFLNPALNSFNYSAQGLHQLQAATLFGISLILATTLFPQSRPQHPASMTVVTLLAPLLLSPETPETQAPVGAKPLPFWCQKMAARYVLPILALLTLHFSLQQYIVVFSSTILSGAFVHWREPSWTLIAGYCSASRQWRQHRTCCHKHWRSQHSTTFVNHLSPTSSYN